MWFTSILHFWSFFDRYLDAETRAFSSPNIIWVEINPWVQWKPLKQLISPWDSRNILAQESWFGHLPGLGGPNKKNDPKESYQDRKSGRNLFLVQYPWISYVLNLACISWKILAQESCFEHFPGLGAPNKKIISKRTISRSKIREEFIFGPISMDILCFDHFANLSEKLAISKVDWKNPFNSVY